MPGLINGDDSFDQNPTLDNLGLPEDMKQELIEAAKAMDLPSFLEYAVGYGVDEKDAQDIHAVYWEGMSSPDTSGQLDFGRPWYFLNNPLAQNRRQGERIMQTFNPGDLVTTKTGTEALEVVKVNPVNMKAIVKDWEGKTQDVDSSDLQLVQSAMAGPTENPQAPELSPPNGSVNKKPEDLALPVSQRFAFKNRFLSEDQIWRLSPIASQASQDDHLYVGGQGKPKPKTVEKKSFGNGQSLAPSTSVYPKVDGHAPKDLEPKLPEQEGILQAVKSNDPFVLAIQASLQMVKSADLDSRSQFPGTWKSGFDDAVSGNSSQGMNFSGDEQEAYFDGFYEGMSQKNPNGPAAAPSVTSSRIQNRRFVSQENPRVPTLGDRLYEIVTNAKDQGDQEALESLAAFLGEHGLSEYLGDNKSSFVTTSAVLDKCEPDDVDIFVQQVEAGQPYSAYDAEGQAALAAAGTLPEDGFLGGSDLEDQSLSDLEAEEGLEGLDEEGLSDLESEDLPLKEGEKGSEDEGADNIDLSGETPPDPNLE